ncbi:solute carrier family 15 member 1-like [Adelges cooleyi]|uniref:solute carrier family 15 member 1-like n=1 Tax=Adelges cooleyi TaxID=133065 RepID=UPI002180250E|nr:solute carrier family 15 member 1-like [Adelges cooleyi]
MFGSLKLPKSIWFIVVTEVCERFSYYGMKAALVMFLIMVQKYSSKSTTILYHSFLTFMFLTPLLGAVLADSYWGKYKTISYLAIIHMIGNFTIALASLITSASLSAQRYVTIIGLILTALGTGGIKPCVSSFGGDQFTIPDQNKQLEYFFSLFYFIINVGALVSLFITPELRNNVKCFGEENCFPLAFGLPAVLMILSLVIFICGKRFYKIKKPESSVITTSFGCIFYAIKKKSTAIISSKTPGKKHWLDYAEKKYSNKDISDIKASLDVLYLFLTLPMFYALYDQFGSNWTLQGTLMNGKLDFLNWTIKPEQMITINCFLVMLFIPFFEAAVFPLIRKVGISTSLQKIIIGGFFTALAFVCSALLQYKIVGENVTLPPNECQLRIFNGFNCNITLRQPESADMYIEPLDVLNINTQTWSTNEKEIIYNLEIHSVCPKKSDDFTIEKNISAVKGEVISYFLTSSIGGNIVLQRLNAMKKLKNGNPNIRILFNEHLTNQNVTLRSVGGKFNIVKYVNLSSKFEQRLELPLDNYILYVQDKYVPVKLDLLPASTNTLILHRSLQDYDIEARMKTLERGNYLHILWQFPQIVVLTVAEVMCMTTLLKFTFTQAPLSMKSFLSSSISIAEAFGNIIVVVISNLNLFEQQAHEYLFYAALMALDMIMLIFMSWKYEYKIFTE